jgi:hypothetical protein
MKQARLPNGKILQFDDGITERDMQRAVRHELGRSNQDIIEGLDTLADKLDTIANKNSTQSFKKLEEAMAMGLGNINRSLKELGNKIEIENAKTLNGLHALTKAIETSDKEAIKTVEKALKPLVKTSEMLSEALTKFKNDAKEAVEYSHDITDANLKASMKAIAGFNKSTDEVAALAKHVEAAIMDLRDSRKVSKRAYKNPDGSWTMEVTQARVRH